LAFFAVATGGFALQIATVALLVAIAWPFLLATSVAVELAVIHNFAWHERWTWADRTSDPGPAGCGAGGIARRFAIYNATTGLTSVAGNLLLTAVYAGLLGASPVVANALAVWTLAIVNFVIADRWVFASAAVILFVAGMPTRGSAATLRPETAAAWDQYVRDVEARIERDPLAPLAETNAPSGETIAVPSGVIHRWRGSVFVPRLTLDAVLQELMWPGTPPPQEDVIASRVLSRGPDALRVYLRLARHTIVTAVYDTEHEMTFRRRSALVATSRSVATRIAEIADAGTDAERQRPPGDDRGFLWRLNSYWRYVQVNDGVRVELDSLTLSRGIPSIIAPIAAPIVRRVSRESLVRTLDALSRWLSSRYAPTALTVMPADSNPARSFAARLSDPGVSPCTQIVSPSSVIVDPSYASTVRVVARRTARATTRSASWITEFGLRRDTS